MGIVEDYWAALAAQEGAPESEHVTYGVPLDEDELFTYWGA